MFPESHCRQNAPRLPHSIKNNRHRHGHPKRYLQRFRVIQRNLRPGQMQRKQGSHHMCQIAQSLADSLLPDDHDHGHRPATRTVPSNTMIRRDGPRNAPSAPTSFQSPPPRLLIRTKGSNSPNPSPAPSSDSLAPAQPRASVLTAIPTSSAGTVSQLGIRRERQSVQPATSGRNCGQHPHPLFQHRPRTTPPEGRARRKTSRNVATGGGHPNVRNWRPARVKTSLNCGL